MKLSSVVFSATDWIGRGERLPKWQKKNTLWQKKNAKKFAYIKKKQYLCSVIQKRY